MLATIVGSVDWNAAAVLIAFFITACVVTTAAIAKRRSKRELEMQFEIDKQKLRNEDLSDNRRQANEHEISMTKLAFDKEVQVRRIDTGLIEGTKVVS